MKLPYRSVNAFVLGSKPVEVKDDVLIVVITEWPLMKFAERCMVEEGVLAVVMVVGWPRRVVGKKVTRFRGKPL